MSLFLVCPELHFTLEIKLSPAVDLQLQTQIERVQDHGDATRFEARLADQLGKILPEVVDWDIKAPTKAQLALAQSLCRQLGIQMSELAKTSRYEMHQFIALMSGQRKPSAALPVTASNRQKKKPS